MTAINHTPLYDLHLALQAKMVPFANYAMPLHYSEGIIAEHLHCRNQAGFFDISHMGQCFLTGEIASETLETLTPALVSCMKPGQQRYSVLTNDNGGVIDDIIISRLENGFLIIVNAACKDKDYALLQDRFGDRFEKYTDRALFALQGPAAAEIMEQLSPPACHLRFMQICQTTIGDTSCIISRSGYTGEDGFEISIAADRAQDLAETILSFEQVHPIGLGARDTLRLEAGLSLYGHELDETISPIEADLSWVVNKNNQRFPGAEIIHRQLREGATRKRIGLKIEGKLPVRERSEIFTADGQHIGMTTSGGYSPSLQQPIALALIDSRCIDSTVISYVRNRRVVLHRTDLPFVPHRYYRG